MTKKKTEIATIASTEVQVIPSKSELQEGMKKTLKELDEKLKELGVSPTPRTFKIGGACYVVYEANYSGTYNPSTLNDIQLLIRIFNGVKRIKKEHEESLKELNLSKSAVPCMIGAYKADDWIEDLEWKIKQLTNAQAVKDITAAKVKLEAFLSEDDRLIKTLAEVEKILK